MLKLADTLLILIKPSPSNVESMHKYKISIISLYASAPEQQKETKWSRLKPQVFVFVTMILQRCGNDGDPLAFFIPTEVNPNPIDQARELYNIQTFGQFVIYGFFFYILLQIISIILDDKSPVMVKSFHISYSSDPATNSETTKLNPH